MAVRAEVAGSERDASGKDDVEVPGRIEVWRSCRNENGALPHPVSQKCFPTAFPFWFIPIFRHLVTRGLSSNNFPSFPSFRNLGSILLALVRLQL
jgi:hypothetical protein